ncbi:MAG: formyltransferase family protein [Methylophaga sp.]
MSKSAPFIVLCAPTARSQAYLQGIRAAGLNPEHIVVYGFARPRNQVTESRGHHLSLIQPDFSVPLTQTIDEAGWQASYIDDEAIGSDAVLAVLETLSPRLTVFSGFGGQLVPSRVLQRVGQLLHIHSGWLPDYRGSTTLYYSLLQERQCAATALLLTEEIDGGPILARKHYPAPDQKTDIDYAYDCAIRTDLLTMVLKDYVAQGSLPEPITAAGDGEMFYVIHPLLKHLAVLSLKESAHAGHVL